MEPIADAGAIFEAWSNEPWTVEGAAVRVSLVCFGEALQRTDENDGGRLDGRMVASIAPDLSLSTVDLTRARVLHENAECASNGVSKKGKFEISGAIARSWIANEHNPNGKSNAVVLSPWRNGEHVMRDPLADMWIIDFSELSEHDAALFEAPFGYVLETVRPFRSRSRSDLERRNWWKLARPATGLFHRLEHFLRFIVVP